MILTEKEIQYIETNKNSVEKLVLMKFQRIYLKYNKNDERNCLCTATRRRIWKEMFFNWYNGVTQN